MTLNAKITELRNLMATSIAGGWLRGPGPFELEVVDEPGIPYDLRLYVDVDSERRRYMCTSLTAVPRKGGPPITAGGLRSIPVGALVRRSVQGQVQVVDAQTAVAPGVTKLTIGRFPMPQRERTSGKRRRTRDEDVRAAAVAYVVAQMCGEPPTKAVMVDLELPLGTARKVVARAREAGLLPPAS
jgi:hypothetical protein